MIDILNLEPTKISRDLRGKYILLYSLPKAGKTSFAVKAPKNLLVAFEMGFNDLGGIKAAPVKSWSDFKKIVRQLKKDEAKEMYQTITIDTITIAWSKVEEYICAINGVEKIADVKWGQGYSMAKKEFENTLRDITMEGYGLICLAHSEEKTVDGTEDTLIRPELNKRAYSIVNGLVDIIGYISVEFNDKGESERFLYTRSTPRLFAGSRFKHLPNKIPFGYETLVEALATAIEKSAEESGVEITSERTDKMFESEPEKPFSEVMDEAKKLWLKIVDDEKKFAQALKIVEKAFGRPFKLSEATEEQQDVVEMIIEELKEIV